MKKIILALSLMGFANGALATEREWSLIGENENKVWIPKEAFTCRIFWGFDDKWHTSVELHGSFIWNDHTIMMKGHGAALGFPGDQPEVCERFKKIDSLKFKSQIFKDEENKFIKEVVTFDIEEEGITMVSEKQFELNKSWL